MNSPVVAVEADQVELRADAVHLGENLALRQLGAAWEACRLDARRRSGLGLGQTGPDDIQA